MCPHQPEGQTEHLAATLQELAKKPPADQSPSDPGSNSGYPAGAERTRPARDAYEKAADETPSHGGRSSTG